MTHFPSLMIPSSENFATGSARFYVMALHPLSSHSQPFQTSTPLIVHTTQPVSRYNIFWTQTKPQGKWKSICFSCGLEPASSRVTEDAGAEAEAKTESRAYEAEAETEAGKNRPRDRPRGRGRSRVTHHWLILTHEDHKRRTIQIVFSTFQEKDLFLLC